MRKIWGNLKFLHDHDKFHSFTKSLKITPFKCSKTFFHKILLFKKKNSLLLLSGKRMYNKFTPASP